MLITRTFFEDLFQAIRAKSTYTIGPQMPMSKKGIILIHPGLPFKLESDAVFDPRDADRLRVALAGFNSRAPVSAGASAVTLSPENLPMRREETLYAPMNLRERLGVIQLFVTPAVEILVTKHSPKTLDLTFVDLGKAVSLTPASL